MSKYLQILQFAFKEQMEYRRNFFFSIITMIVNDAIFLAVFVIFLSYFSGTGLTFGSFLLVFAFMTFHYGMVNGVCANIGEIPEIIEEGKMDYYLSFPVSPLSFLASKSIKVHNLWDMLFALIAITISIISFQDGNAGILIGKRILLALISSFFVIGLYIMVGSISFRLQRGSKIKDTFQQFFLAFGSYPPELFSHNKIMFLLISFAWIYPGIYLPYYIMMGEANRTSRLLLIWASAGMFIAGICVFRQGLKRYSSGNLVLQM